MTLNISGKCRRVSQSTGRNVVQWSQRVSFKFQSKDTKYIQYETDLKSQLESCFSITIRYQNIIRKKMFDSLLQEVQKVMF